MNRAPSIISIHHGRSYNDKEYVRTPVKNSKMIITRAPSITSIHHGRSYNDKEYIRTPMKNSKMIITRAPSITSIHHARSYNDKEYVRIPVKAMAFDSSMLHGARICLMILNIMAVILSVAIIGLAASLYMAGEIATDTEVITLLKQMTTSNEISIGTLMRKISMAILVVGVFIVMAFFFGFFAAFYRSRPMHILYLIICGPIFGFVIFVNVIWFILKDQVSYTAKHKMLELLKFYEGNTQRSLTKAWNNLFVWFDCCGVNAQSDMDDFLETKWNTSSRGNQIVPGYCCKYATTITGMDYFSKTCTTSPTLANSYINKGCYKEILNYLLTYTTGFLVITFMLLFILFAVMTLGLVIVVKTKDRKKPLHAPIYEKYMPGTCSEHNTIIAPESAIATLDEGQRPVTEVNHYSCAPSGNINVPHDYPTMANVNCRDGILELHLRIPMGCNKSYEEAALKQQLMNQRFYW